MRVLLTGASGFIGRATLAALLRRDADVVALSRRKPIIDGHYQWIKTDLLGTAFDESAIRGLGIKVVIHLAWTVEHGLFWSADDNLAWTAASLRLGHVARQAGATRFIGVGTCYEYDWPPSADCDDLRTALRPDGLYATAKDATRRLLEAYFIQHEIAFSWVRPFFLYGNGETPQRLVASICRALVTGQPARCSAGLVLRDYADVADVGEAIAAVASSRLVGPVNVGSGQPTTVAHIAGELGRIAGRPDLIQLGALPTREGDPPRITANISRLITETDVRPYRKLEQGLTEALSYWGQHPLGSSDGKADVVAIQ